MYRPKWLIGSFRCWINNSCNTQPHQQIVLIIEINNLLAYIMINCRRIRFSNYCRLRWSDITLKLRLITRNINLKLSFILAKLKYETGTKTKIKFFKIMTKLYIKIDYWKQKIGIRILFEFSLSNTLIFIKVNFKKFLQIQLRDFRFEKI